MKNHIKSMKISILLIIKIIIFCFSIYLLIVTLGVYINCEIDLKYDTYYSLDDIKYLTVISKFQLSYIILIIFVLVFDFIRTLKK